MNNEDKIMSTLDTLVLMVTSLAKSQAKLETRVEDIHCNLAALEIENSQAHGGIFDKLDDLEKKTDRNTEAIARIEDRLDSAEISIRVFDTKLRKVQP